MSKVASWDRNLWNGEGPAAEHLNPAWEKETTRITTMMRAATGGKGEIVVSFPAYRYPSSQWQWNKG